MEITLLAILGIAFLIASQTIIVDKKLVKKVFNKWYDLARKYSGDLEPKNERVRVEEILAIIAVESSGNQWAEGDKGESIGLMQVSAIAVADVNRHLGTNYIFSKELFKQNPDLNIAVGSHYLEMCFDYAISKLTKVKKSYTDDEIRFLAYRIYNAGPGKVKVNNLISIGYATKVKAYREEFKKLIRV